MDNDNTDNDNTNFTIEAFTLLGIGIAIIILRLYARISTVGLSRLQPDDALMSLAAIVYSIETALAYSVGAYWSGLANNNMSDEDRISLEPQSREYQQRVNGSKTQIAGWSTYTTLLWLIKAAMCTFYLRLTEGLEFRNRIYIGFGLLGTTYLAVILTILLSCYPLSRNWQIYPDPGKFCQPAVSQIDIFVTLVLNVLTDLYLWTIPIPMLLQVNLRPAKKAGLIVLFSGGIFVMMAGILRCVLILTDPVKGAENAGYWAVRETFVAVVTSNIPMIVPLINRWSRPVAESIRSMSPYVGKVSGFSRPSMDSRAYRLEDKNPRRGMGPRSIHPITNTSFDCSQDRVCSDEEALGALATEKTPQNGTHAYGHQEGRPQTSLVPTPVSGGILKKTSLEVSESRPRKSDENIGGYYLVQQASRIAGGERTAAGLHGCGTKKGKPSSSLPFGIGR
ncbi:hypothetical protein V8F20_007317 [Naviculisporaceae sp. PSN 640]